MFGGLRKKLNDVWSGADFWDEEENRAQRVQAAKPTVQTRPVQAPKAPPVRTINARQNNARAIDQSYGSGFDRFVNKSRDMFDANTQADRIRRFATTGIDESYDQQQRKQTIAAQTNPEKRSLLEQVGYNVMGAQAEIAKVPSASQKLVGTALKSDNPIIKMGTSRFLDQNPFTGTLNSIDTVLPGSKKTAGKALQSFGANNEKLITNKLEQSRFGQKESDNKLVAGVSRALGQLSSQIGANVVAPGSGAAIGSVPLASSEYDKAKQSGKTDDQALGIAGLQGTVAAGLEQVGLGRLGKGAGTRLVKGLRNFATEGSTEGIQQFGQNLVANKAYNPNQGLTEGVKESVLYGGIAGGVAGSVMGGNKPKRPTTNLVSKPTPTPQPNLNRNEAYTLSDQQEVNLGRIKDPRTVNAVSRDAFNIAKRSGIDITSGSPREINDRINSVLEQPQNSRRFFKPLDQRGSIQVPGGKDVDPLESLKQEARKLDEQVRSYDTKKNFRGFRESDDARKLVELESKLQDSNKTISRLENPVDKVTVSQIENMGRKAILEGSVSKADLVKQFNKMGKEKFPSNQKRYIDDTYGSVEAYYDDVIAKGEAGVVENFSQLAGVPTSPQFEDFYNRTVLNRNKTGLNGNEPKINKVERKITETEPKRTEKATQSQPPKSTFEQNLEQAGVKPKKGVVLSEGYTKGGQRYNKVLRGPGKSSIDEDTAYNDMQRGLRSESDRIADSLGIPQDQRAPTFTGEAKSSITRAVEQADNATIKDSLDQRDYGVKDIQQEPTNTIQGVFDKYLDQDTYTEQELNQSNRTGVRGVRDKVARANPLRATENLVGKGFEMASRGNRATRAIARAAQYVNKTAGQDPAMLEAAKRYSGDSTYTDASLVELGGKAYGLLPNERSRQMVHAVLDPEAARGAVKYDDLNPQEKQAADMLRDLGDSINDTSFRAGMISRKKWESNRGGRYIARLYNDIQNAPDVADLLDLPDSRGLFLGMYKSRVDLNDALRQKLIKDPVKLAVIRARQVRSNEALMGYMREAEKRGYVQQKPTKGYVKISQEPGGRMHNWNGKYVRQDVYENINGYKALYKSANALNNVLDLYDGNPARRIRKKMLTLYNPVVRTGNVTSNYFFAFLNGVNPARFQVNKSWAKKALKNNDKLVLAAQKAGLVRNDIISSDKNLFDTNKQFNRDLTRASAKNMIDKVKNAPKAFDDKVGERYGRADDIAKLAALKAHVDRGYSVNEAIKKTARGFQDYSRVGHMYDLAAKAPVFGNAFVRFQGDLYTNILKNAAVDHPFRLAALPVAVLALGEGLSALSGETEEDKKTRETRLGAPKIPFTNISSEFQTPFGAVDVARFTPLYMRNVLNEDGGKGTIADDISRLMPFNIPGKNTKQEWARAASSDPLIGPIIQQLADTDWKGKSITDPDGMRDGKQLFPDNPLSDSAKNKNRMQYAARNYLPYPFNELGDIGAAINQDKRNEQTAPGTKNDPRNASATFLGSTGFNTSGSKKSVGQATARLFGVRAQQFGKDEAKQQRENEEMFAYFDKVDKFKTTLDSSTREQFDLRHKSNQTRSGLKKELTEDPWYKYKNAGELLQNPKLFDAEKKYAEMQNKYDGRPIDPIFNLPTDQRNVVLAKKLKLPGSKDEGFNTLYDQPWYQDFRKQQDDYYKAKDGYKEKRGFADIKETNPYPEADPETQKAMDYYFSLPSGTGARSGFIRANPDVWNAITGQWDKQNAWTDEERRQLGLPAIEREESGSKYASSGKSGGRGKGRGGKGGRGGKRASKYDYTKDLFGSGGNIDSNNNTKALRAILAKAMSGKS